MDLRTVVLVSAVVALAGCSGLSGDSTPTPDMSEPEITVQSPTPEDTHEATDAPEPTVTATPTKDTPTDTPTDTTPTGTVQEDTWPPYDFAAASGDTSGDVATDEPASANAGGSGNVSAK